MIGLIFVQKQNNFVQTFSKPTNHCGFGKAFEKLLEGAYGS